MMFTTVAITWSSEHKSSHDDVTWQWLVHNYPWFVDA